MLRRILRPRKRAKRCARPLNKSLHNVRLRKGMASAMP